MTDEDFLNFLTIAVANLNKGERPNRKTQLDLVVFWETLAGLPCSLGDDHKATWEPFEDKAYDELLCGLSAAIHKEAKRRYLLKISS
jgi:hypothetical protein